MPTLETRIQELIQFYVKSNYENYLRENSLKCIPTEKVREVVTSLYTDRKEHLKDFIKLSLKSLLKDDYPGDLVVLNIILSVFEDDALCINRSRLGRDTDSMQEPQNDLMTAPGRLRHFRTGVG